MSRVLALHGFLGRGSDWAAVRAASRADIEWMCPDLFAPGASAMDSPPSFAGKAWLAGYSFGGRLAIDWMVRHPGRWHGALLLSVDPGNFQNEAQRVARRKSDKAWAAAFRTEPWEELMDRWNAQPVFERSTAPLREERNFDRAGLASVLERFSVADQFTDVARLEGEFIWLAGGQDDKFCGLLGSMRNAGFPGSFFAVPRAGHRLLQDAPFHVAAALDRLVTMR